jgi:DNA-binding IclR family transcriptional regulator
MTIVKRGERAPLLYGATGKILLAHMEKERIGELAAALPSADREALFRQLERFRHQGYAVTKSERIAGVTAISVPIHDIEKPGHYSLAITGPSVRIDPKRVKFTAALVAAGKRLTAQLGGSAGVDAEAEKAERPVRRKAAPAKKAAKKLEQA